MARAAVLRDVWDVLEAGDLNALKAVTPSGFDWRSAQCPVSFCTPLQEVLRGIAVCTDGKEADEWLSIAAWLMDQGADPTTQASGDVDEFSVWKSHDKEGTTIEVTLKDRSAISAAVSLRKGMLDSQENFWEDDIDNISKLVDLFSMPPRRSQPSRVMVDGTVVDRWAAMLQDTTDHDVVFETSDGPCTAHASVLQRASPVLKASLSSAMIEGQRKRIAVSDMPAAAIGFFLELMYTGGSCSDVSAATALAALELAHRWQVDDVVVMVANFLESLLTESTFESIASAAQLLQLVGLRHACVAFANKSDAIKQKVQQGAMVSAVMNLLGKANSPCGQGEASKKRRMF